MKAKVYFNLHKKLWSIKTKVDGKWKVTHYADTVLLAPTKYHVSEPTRLKIVRDLEENGKRNKNIHAWIEGDILEIDGKAPSALGDAISYNPYFSGFYYTSHDKQPIDTKDKTTLFFNKETKKAHKVL